MTSTVRRKAFGEYRERVSENEIEVRTVYVPSLYVELSLAIANTASDKLKRRKMTIKRNEGRTFSERERK